MERSRISFYILGCMCPGSLPVNYGRNRKTGTLLISSLLLKPAASLQSASSYSAQLGTGVLPIAAGRYRMWDACKRAHFAHGNGRDFQACGSDGEVALQLF